MQQILGKLTFYKLRHNFSIKNTKLCGQLKSYFYKAAFQSV